MGPQALTNLVWAGISDLGDVKCSANWMWAAKLPGEGAAMWDACEAMVDLMVTLGVGVDGGKDSLSMAAKTDNETVKAPGTATPSSTPCCALRPICNPSPCCPPTSPTDCSCHC